MPLSLDLSSGVLGVRWKVPAACSVKEDLSRMLVMGDPERQVVWMVRVHPWPLDVGEAHDKELRADIEVDARHIFDTSFEPGRDLAGEKLLPRTSDATWSPVIEIRRVPLGETIALCVVRRITYQPGNEILCGSLSIPLAEGHAEISAILRASATGLRESVLIAKTLHESPGEDFSPRPQSFFDDPSLDTIFPDHPLSRVRAALGWLGAEAGVEVLRPATPPEGGERTLSAAGCSVVLPPRFGFVPRSVLPMSESLVSFVRVGVGDVEPRMLDVWRLPERLSGADRSRALKRFASKNIEGWAREGVLDLEHDAEVISSHGQEALVRAWARFRVGEQPKISCFRWRVDEDGTLFRVCAGGPPHVPESQYDSWAAEVMGSLRRHSPLAPGRKPWWKFW